MNIKGTRNRRIPLSGSHNKMLLLGQSVLGSGNHHHHHHTSYRNIKETPPLLLLPEQDPTTTLCKMSQFILSQSSLSFLPFLLYIFPLQEEPCNVLLKTNQTPKSFSFCSLLLLCLFLPLPLTNVYHAHCLAFVFFS